MKGRTTAAATLTTLFLCQQPSALHALTNSSPFSTTRGDDSTSMSMSATTTATDPLAPVREALDNSWIAQLSPETADNLAASRARAGLSKADDESNQRKRPVLNGHYVLVRPQGLSDSRLVLSSPDVARGLLQLTDAQVATDDFVAWVSGNLHLGPSWATPYALSIMGTRYTHNCPYGDGTGYGDGRAMRYVLLLPC
jgi:hypothetical protein